MFTCAFSIATEKYCKFRLQTNIALFLMCTAFQFSSTAFMFFSTTQQLIPFSHYLSCQYGRNTWWFLLPYSIRKWKYGDGEKNRVRYRGWFWLYYPQNVKKSVCVSVFLCVELFLWRMITAANSKTIKYFSACVPELILVKIV